MKIFDRLGQPISIGSIVLMSFDSKQDPVLNYGVVADFSSVYNELILVKPVKEKNGDKYIITTHRRVIPSGGTVTSGNETALQFPSLLVQHNVPESITGQIYRAILHRASKSRG